MKKGKAPNRKSREGRETGQRTGILKRQRRGTRTESVVSEFGRRMKYRSGRTRRPVKEKKG